MKNVHTFANGMIGDQTTGLYRYTVLVGPPKVAELCAPRSTCISCSNRSMHMQFGGMCIGDLSMQEVRSWGIRTNRGVA